MTTSNHQEGGATVGRPSAYTEEQDAIILSTDDSKVINERFIEMGHEPRSANALSSRRAYLRKQGLVQTQGLPGARRLTLLFKRRQTIQAELTKLVERLERLREERQEVNDAIVALLEDIQEDVAEENGNDGQAGEGEGSSGGG